MNHLALLLIAFLLLFCRLASGANYQFTKIADTAGEFTELSPFVTINELGTVAFTGRRANGVTGVFTGSGGAISTIASTADGFWSIELTTPAINNQEQVAFVGSSVAAGFGVHRSDGVTTTPIAVQSSPFAQFDGQFVLAPAINNFGAVGFWAKLNLSIDEGVFINDGATTFPIVTSAGPPYGVLSDFVSLNDSGQVAAYATLDVGGDAIIRGNGAAPPVIIASSNNGFSVFASGADISASGQVAFAGRRDDGTSGVFVGDGAAVSVFADDSGAFSSFSIPAINDLDQIAFRAVLDPTGVGIFVGPDPIVDKVIRSGDPLFGSTVTTSTSFSGLSLVRGGFNNAGQIAFTYTLANGVSGIAIATPVPEPSTFVLAALCASILFFRRLR